MDHNDRLQEVGVTPVDFALYEEIISPELYKEVLELSQALRGAKIIVLNSTPSGGGVSEIFQSLVPLMQSVGIDMRWLVIPPKESFYNITKGFHNALQGASSQLTEQDKQQYLEHNRLIAELLKKEAADIFEIHDPQPAAVIESYNMPRSIWRCHIDTSEPNLKVWNFLKPFIQQYDELIFTLKDYVPAGFQHRSVNLIAPSIGALAPMNRPLATEEAQRLVTELNIATNKPFVVQVSRFDRWKDPMGVVNAYRLAKRSVPDLQLVLVGSTAIDDPEGPVIYERVKKYVKNDSDVFLLSSLREKQINALRTCANVVIQKSIREGFGLTVAEGMWKARPVIGGNTPGIRLQIKDGETGYLVDSVEQCAKRIVTLINDPQSGQHMGMLGREVVRKHFLHPRLMRDHLLIYKRLLEK